MIGNETADAVAKPYYNRIKPPKLRDNPEISLQKEKKTELPTEGYKSPEKKDSELF